MKIKNIIFDLGGVIINLDYNRTANAFKELGFQHFDTIYSQKKQEHLFGAFAGLLCAWGYRAEGPQRPVYEWENEEEDEPLAFDEEGKIINVNYHYLEGNDQLNTLINSMMLKIEHIGIAVKNIQLSNELFRKIFNTSHYKTEAVASEGVTTSFFKVGENKIELLEAMHDESPVAKFIEKKGEGIHHIAFAVDDIIQEMDRLEKEGFVLLNKIPKQGADNKLVCFLHPKDTNGVLIELCQELKE